MRLVYGVIVCAISLLAVACQPAAKDACWETYCKVYGIDSQNPTNEQTIYYMDVWVEGECDEYINQ